MLDSQETQTIRTTIRSLLARCNVPYRVTSFDHGLYQECIDEAVRRGYAVEGDHSVRTFLRVGVDYAATAGGYLTHRPTQIWMALYTSCATYIDDAPVRFPAEVPNIYRFNDRFVERQSQGNPVLDAFADLIRRAVDLFQSIPSRLVITSGLNFVTANLLEYETASMQIASMAEQYPVYRRNMTAVADTYAYMVFPHEIPLTEYVQAIPEVMLFITDMNDVLSFYKEELEGENNNHIAIIAARNRESHLETFIWLAEIALGHYRKVLKILGGSPVACEAFKRFCVGYVDFHTSSKRYKLAELNL